MSDLQRELAFQLKLAQIPFEPEFKAVPGRRLRWDFRICSAAPGLLVEVQGGIWKVGGHSTGKGITRDMAKLNLATIAGYRCLQVGAEHIRSGQALRWIQEALEAA